MRLNRYCAGCHRSLRVQPLKEARFLVFCPECLGCEIHEEKKATDAELEMIVDSWLYRGFLYDCLPVPWDKEVKTIGCSVNNGVVRHPSLKPSDVERLGLRIKIGGRNDE